MGGYMNTHVIKRRIFFLTSAFVIVFLLSTNSLAINFSVDSDREIKGSSSKLKVKFSGKVLKDDTIEVTIKFKGKRITVQINEEEIEIYLRSKVIKNDKVAMITEDESDILKEFLLEMLDEDIGNHKLGKTFLRTVNLLYSWPSNVPLEFSMNKSRIAGYKGLNLPTAEDNAEETRISACEWPPPTGLSDNICSEMNMLHSGDFLSLGYPLKWIIKPFFGIFYPLRCTPFQEYVGPYPFEDGDCFGRCGKGCLGDGPPNLDVNIFTQNCFNHDDCVGELGYIHPYCNQMILYTIADSIFGPECNP